MPPAWTGWRGGGGQGVHATSGCDSCNGGGGGELCGMELNGAEKVQELVSVFKELALL